MTEDKEKAIEKDTATVVPAGAKKNELELADLENAAGGITATWTEGG